MDDAFTRLAQLIQISVAPVFLLTGIAGMLNVMAHRLARIIDRTRSIESGRAHPEGIDAFGFRELSTLRNRINTINRAIALCTYSALLVSAVIVALFLGAFFRFDLTTVVAVLFIGAILFLIGGLLSFLGEVHMATRYMRQLRE